MIKFKLSPVDFMRIDLAIMKESDLINDYKIESHKENVTIAKDGVKEYDLKIKVTVTPKKVVEYIEVKNVFKLEGEE